MNKIEAQLEGQIISSNSPEAYMLNKKRLLGEKIREKIRYSFYETAYLLDTNNLELFQKKRKISFQDFLNKIRRFDKKIQINYPIFKDLRERGYILKTALKFGADFRVYEKTKSGIHKHAKWILFIDSESGKLNWKEFSAKNRIAHSTKKKLLIALIDSEERITYYETIWMKP